MYLATFNTNKWARQGLHKQTRRVVYVQALGMTWMAI
jgi:hypothetical protein